MVNLVIVSHCRKLAQGVKELADQMTGGKVQIAAVGGLIDDEGTEHLGTDALRISAAIDQIWTEEGVLVLVDLGSAILSTELALDLLPDERREACLISNAPIVEGAGFAAVEASLHHSLETVNQAAEQAYTISKVSRDTT